jgi:hypothetical protein
MGHSTRVDRIANLSGCTSLDLATRHVVRGSGACPRRSRSLTSMFIEILSIDLTFERAASPPRAPYGTYPGRRAHARYPTACASHAEGAGTRSTAVFRGEPAAVLEVEVEERTLPRGCRWAGEEHDHGAERVVSDHPRHLGSRANEGRGVKARGDPPLERGGIASPRFEQEVPRRRKALHVGVAKLFHGIAEGLHAHVGDAPKQRHVP